MNQEYKNQVKLVLDVLPEVAKESCFALHGAALDRQHPRDLFDVKYLLQNEGFTTEIKKGFIYCLLGSDRPINEILNPHLLNQESVIISQFEGLSSEPFEYKEYVEVRKQLVQIVQNSLTAADKDFLLQFKNLSPVWDGYNYEEYPSIRWKLKNLRNLREKNPEKHTKQYSLLYEFLKGLQN